MKYLSYFYIGDFVNDIFNGISDGVGDVVGGVVDQIAGVLEDMFYKVFYGIVIAICELVRLIYEFFAVFAGINKVTYDGKAKFLINVFFENKTVTNVYMGMAMIGAALCIVATMVAVIKKMFDGRDKDQRSMGAILGSMAKSLVLIFTMNFIILAVISLSNVLLQQVNYVFDYADDLGKPKTIDFTDEQYAAMARIFNTIGNYSLNNSPDTSYNINSCYNAVRPDLEYLMNEGVFEFYYLSTDKNGIEIDTWQSLLQKLVNAADVRTELKLDVYNKPVADAMLKIMSAIKTNKKLKPLSHYERITINRNKSQQVSLDYFLFLVCSYKAAKNSAYNQNPSLTDALRGPYYYGQKSIYDYDSVYADFSLSLTKYNYLLLIGGGIMLLWNIFMVLFACVSRIFNMMLLYLIAPLIFAFEPVDDGEKRKQWTIAFTVQSTSVLATVIAMRVAMLFIPIIMSDKLVLFSDVNISGTSINVAPILNLIGKLFLTIVGFSVSKKASGMLTGIMANSAGMQSIGPDASQAANNAMSMAGGLAKGAVGLAVGAAVMPAQTGMNMGMSLGKMIGSKISGSGSGSGGSGGSGGEGGGSEPEPLPQNQSQPDGSSDGPGGGSDLPDSQGTPGGGGGGGTGDVPMPPANEG